MKYNYFFSMLLFFPLPSNAQQIMGEEVVDAATLQAKYGLYVTSAVTCFEKADAQILSLIHI